MKKIITSLLFCFTIIIAQAQDTTTNETTMADVMRSNGKIYVVVAVMVTILLGIIGYLVRLDKKISKLEKTGSDQHT